ncbi:hypothetical protein WICPIJ_006866 [Wickerhamomyces pijperi]|uniref:Zn(2)-C6 fungal-type domain-containing protein n=1 Tax=Wickerhamomyces pijperi TaxID=599730 RepID=A0A9P8Q3N5_WICPI|nr:hypothetical protein WICPIJ_006866 [Wickerhamomyces pijperi]
MNLNPDPNQTNNLPEAQPQPIAPAPLYFPRNMEINMANESDTDKIKYKRNYKACLNCRTRKVRCDLGPYDSPHDPPCARCLRERRECIFSDYRRGSNLHKKRKLEEVAAANEEVLAHDNKNNRPPSVNSIASPHPLSTPISASNSQQHTPQLSRLGSYPTLQVASNQQEQQSASETPVLNQQQQSLSGSGSGSSTNLQAEETNAIPPPPPSSEFSTTQGALVFLARAAGTIARSDDRDHINAREMHQQFETETNNDTNKVKTGTAAVSGSSNPSTSSGGSASDNNSNKTKTTNTANGENELGKTNDFDSNYNDLPPLIRPVGRNPLSMPPIDKSTNVHPNPSKTLADIDYIGENKMLTVEQAEHLIRLFFLTLHPFFPHIPKQLHDPQVLAGYPILLCAILTISARYHSLEEEQPSDEAGGAEGSPAGTPTDGNANERPQFNSNSKNIQLHERLWIYCQRLISQTVWAEASTRSIGTVLAFLLFTEWNPRAIHWRWSDYANNNSSSSALMTSTDSDGKPKSEEELGLTGLSAMRRSDRMAWMLIGSSVRLAQDMGFINTSSKIFVATHIAETHTAMNLGKRSMLAHSLAEIDLDTEENGEVIDAKKQYMDDELILNLDEEQLIKRHHGEKKKLLKFSFMQKAKLELLKIMSLAYETIYSNNETLNDQLQHRQNLTILSILSPLIENWYKTYKKLLKPSNPKNFNQHCNLNNAGVEKHVSEITKQIEKESLICDYYYCQLYIYSLSLTMENSPTSNTGTSSATAAASDAPDKKLLNNIKLDEISKVSKFIEIAYNAAKEILNIAIRVHKLKMLKYMPVRWVTRIVRSVAFIVKCFLTLTNNSANSKISNGSGIFGSKKNSIEFSTIMSLSLTPTEEIIQIIQKASIVLREASPDELHLCTRYSTILMYLCLEMKYRSKISFNVPQFDKLSTSDDDDDDNEEGTTATSNTNTTASATAEGTAVNTASAATANASIPSYQPSQQMYTGSVNNLPPQYSTNGLPPQQHQLPTDDNPFAHQFNYPHSGATTNGLQPLPDNVIDWFLKNDESIGLNFVEPWTEMIEQHLEKRSG